MTLTQDEIKAWNDAKGKRQWYKCRYHDALFPTEKNRTEHEKAFHP